MSMPTENAGKTVFEPFGRRLGPFMRWRGSGKMPLRRAFGALALKNTDNKRLKRSKRRGRKRTARSASADGALPHHDLRGRPRAALILRELLPYTPGDVLVDLRVRAVGLGDDDGMALIRRGADVEMKRNLAQER